MFYEQVQKLSAADFRRLTCVKPETFDLMLGVLREAEAISACVAVVVRSFPLKTSF